MIAKTMRFIAVTPFVGIRSLITADGRPLIRGAVIGATALTLMTGHLNAMNAPRPISPEQVSLLLAQAQAGDALPEWGDGRAIPLSPLVDQEVILPLPDPDRHRPVPIPGHKPEREGYTLSERTALTALIRQTNGDLK